MSTDVNDSIKETKRTVEPLDTIYNVVAPENVAFQYRLAGPFLRAFAWTIDMTIIFCWLLGSTIFAAYLFFEASHIFYGEF